MDPLPKDLASAAPYVTWLTTGQLLAAEGLHVLSMFLELP